jgi:membrane-associated phospholipid phosphatase
LRSLALGGSRVSDLSPLAGLAVAPALGVPQEPVIADPVVFWNDQTNRAIQATKTDPFVASRALALESIAVLDTIRSIQGEPAFLVRLPAPSDVPMEVAVAAAAHAMLSHLFMVRQAALDAALASELARQPAGLSRRRATEFGRAVADGVIAMREQDGWNAAGTSRTGTAPGQWRPTPPDFLPAMDPQWASMEPFVLTRPSQFRPFGPPPPGSAAFSAARAAVASLGAARSATRTAEQTEIAHYWSDAIGTYAPAGHWNAIAARIVAPMQLGMPAEAEMFTELNVGIADAAIAMADAKYAYWSWRPVTAIRAGDEGGAPVPDWIPLLETPNHPSYISGHSSFSGAASVILTKWFGTRPFTFASASLPGVTRSFTSFEQAAEEAARSRVYGGIHFPFDNADGLATGRLVGAWTLAMFQRRAEDRGPFIMVDGPMDPADQNSHAVTGCALDNLSPVAAVTARLDDAAPVSVVVDEQGLFAVPPPLLGASGRHRMVLAATSISGRTTAVQLDIEDRVAGAAVMVPATAK